MRCFETLIAQTKDHPLFSELEADQACLHTNQINHVKPTPPAFVHTFLALHPPSVSPLLSHTGSGSIYAPLEQTLAAEK